MKTVINGVELPDVDYTDVEVLSAYENGLGYFEATRKQFSGAKDISDVISGIQAVCDSVADWLDDIYGAGTGDAVFQGKASMKLALEAPTAIVEACRQSFEECTKITQTLQSTQGNRQQRREAQRGQKRRHSGGAKGAPADTKADDDGCYGLARIT